MNQKTQINMLVGLLVVAFIGIMLHSNNVYAIMPVTPPVTSPVTPPTTPRPTYTPRPFKNSIPEITTFRLPNGIQNRKYTMTVKGFDNDKNDKLTISANGLPKGLTIQKCEQRIENNKKTIQCLISGHPIKPGNYNVRLTISDNKGGTTSKNLFLKILN